MLRKQSCKQRSKNLLLQNINDDENSNTKVIRSSFLGLRSIQAKVFDGNNRKLKRITTANGKISNVKHMPYFHKKLCNYKSYKWFSCSKKYFKFLKTDKKLSSDMCFKEFDVMNVEKGTSNINDHDNCITVDQKQNRQSSVYEHIYIGQVVWARLSFCSVWPAIVIEGEMCGQVHAEEDKCWVFWFGDHNVSEVPKSNVFDFRDHFDRYYNEKNSKKSYETGVYEALELYYTRKSLTSEKLCENMKDVKLNIPQWVLLIMENYNNLNSMKKFTNLEEEDVTKIISDEKISHSTKEHSPVKYEPSDKMNNIKFAEGYLCIICKTNKGSCNHPFIRGKMCSACKEHLASFLYAFDTDGYSLYCVICGHREEVFLCDNKGCNKVFCCKCMTNLLGPSQVQHIRSSETWVCFICNPTAYNLIGCQEVIDNWKEELNLMFQPEPVVLPSTKRRIRVLSLFDGISTGKVVLDQLKIDLEIYYASEIDADSLLVSKGRHGGVGGVVQWIGDVTNISSQLLKEIGPIDLLIGGSPCNEFSIANPGRKGLSDEGTGALFFEFYRILKELQGFQTPDRPLFWLFENVASMQKQCRATMTRFFKCYPAILDAKFFSAQNRSRLFWGNIPNMHCPPQFSKALACKYLNDNLFPGRHSQVDKLRTVTTRHNSMLQGSNNEKPVTFLESNEESLLWMPELERVFGFPDHYTDVGDLPRGRRQKLIGQAWSVHVVKHILSPLTEILQLKV